MTRRTKAQWQALIEQQQSSGLMAAEFCRQQNLNPKYFSLRKKQLCQSSNGFVKIAPLQNPIPQAPSVKLRVIEVEVPGCASESLSVLLDNVLR